MGVAGASSESKQTSLRGGGLLEGFMDPTTPQSDKHIYCAFAARNLG